MNTKEIILYDSYYSTKKEQETRDFIFDSRADDEGWKLEHKPDDERNDQHDNHACNDFCYLHTPSLPSDRRRVYAHVRYCNFQIGNVETQIEFSRTRG